MLHVDIPTTADLSALTARRADPCVSIYLPTTPLSQDSGGDRIELKNLAKQAVDQLEAAGADKRRVAALGEQIDDLVDDDAFWRMQAHGLALFATADDLRTFRVPTALTPSVAVSDRFRLTPLLRAVSFAHVAYVLALAEGGPRLVAVSADLPATTVKVEGMPKDAGSAVGRSSVNDRSPSGRIQGSEGQKVLLRQFARVVDGALRGLLAGSGVPLVLAASQPLASIYRSVNTYAGLAESGIEASPETLSDGELAERARAVLDELHREELAGWTETFEARAGQHRTTTDIAGAARAATFGAVDSLLVDIDAAVHGTVGDEDGAVRFADHAGADSHDVLDEIARRVIAAGGRVYGVRADDIPGGFPLAAILRYTV